MNPDTNKLEPLSEMLGELYRPNGEKVPKHWTVFTDGELIVVKNYTFKIAHLGESYLILEPVSPVVVDPDEDAARARRGEQKGGE